MKQEKEMKYEAPEVIVLEVEVEKGFAASPENEGNGPSFGGSAGADGF